MFIVLYKVTTLSKTMKLTLFKIILTFSLIIFGVLENIPNEVALASKIQKKSYKEYVNKHVTIFFDINSRKIIIFSNGVHKKISYDGIKRIEVKKNRRLKRSNKLIDQILNIYLRYRKQLTERKYRSRPQRSRPQR